MHSRYSNLLSVGDYNIVDVFGLPKLSKILVDLVLIEDVQKTTFWLPEQPGEVLYGITLCRCIDDAKHLFQVVLDQLFVVY